MGIIEIKVKTNQKEQKIETNGNNIIVSLTEVPKDGKANEELVKYLRKVFKKPVSLVSGQKSKNKTILIEGLENDKIMELTFQAFAKAKS